MNFYTQLMRDSILTEIGNNILTEIGNNLKEDDEDSLLTEIGNNHIYS